MKIYNYIIGDRGATVIGVCEGNLLLSYSYILEKRHQSRDSWQLHQRCSGLVKTMGCSIAMAAHIYGSVLEFFHSPFSHKVKSLLGNFFWNWAAPNWGNLVMKLKCLQFFSMPLPLISELCSVSVISSF